MLVNLRKKIAQFFTQGEGEKGVAAVEFALGGTLVMITVITVMELLTVMFVSVLIEGGVREAARFGTTGAGVDRQASIEQIIQDNTLGLVDMDTVSITTMVYDSFGEIGQPEDFTDDNGNDEYDAGEAFVDDNGNGAWDDDRGRPGLGGASEIVVYTVEYDWNFFVSALVEDVMGQSIRLSSVVPVRNEPYEVIEQ